VNEKRIFPRIRAAEQAEGIWTLIGLVAAFSLILGLFGEEGRMLLRYDRAGLQAGEFWRLLSAHFVHLGWSHIALNLVALMLLGALFHGCMRWTEWIAVVTSSGVAIDLGLYVLSPTVDWYVGLSGILHGIALAGACALLTTDTLTGLALILLIAAKLTYEQTMGPVPFSSASVEGDIVVDSHLYGAIGGGLAWLSMRILRRVRTASL